MRARTKPVQTPLSISKIGLPPVVDDASVTPQYSPLFMFLPLFHDVRVGLVVVRLVSRLFAVVFVIGYLFLAILPSVCG